MCWKCCLCMCCCSVDHDEVVIDEATQRSRDIDRMMNAEHAELRDMGVRSIEDKNWQPFILAGRTYFIHGSGTAPKIIRGDGTGSLNPAFGRESCKVNGIPGKYLLAFACQGNQIPDEVELKGAAKVLWGVKEFPFMYIFHVDAQTRVFQSPFSGQVGLQTEARGGSETGFDTAVPWDNIDRVFQYNKKTGTYERNRNYG